MKSNVIGSPSSRLSGPASRRLLAWSSALMLAALTVSAADIQKADNTDALSLGSSWVGGVAPGVADTAVWGSTVSAANTGDTLGTNVAWGGIRILNPAAAISIGADGNTLTLGAGGIDMSAATVGLNLGNNLTLAGSAVQSWNIGNSQALSLTGSFTRSAAALVRFNVAAGSSINMTGITGGTGLYYSLLNGTDIGAVDGSQNVAPAASVVSYIQNTPGGDGYASGEVYLDVINGNSSGDDVDLAGVDYWGIIRFNAQEPYRNYWVFNAGTHPNEVGGSGSLGMAILVTTNVGAQDVIMEGSANIFRWNGGGNELFLDQENTAGTLYINGVTSQRTGRGIITKSGAGRVVWNATFANSGAINVLAGEFMVNNTVNSGSTVTVASGATLSGSGTIPGAANIINGGTVQPGGTTGQGSLSIGNLTLNSGSTLAIKSSAASLNVTGGLAINGAVNLSVVADIPSVGQYQLFKWTNGIPADLFTNFNLVTLPLRTFGYLSNNTANGSIDLVVTNVNEPIKWATGNGNWDIATTANWVDTLGASTTYQEANGMGDAVLFDDTASGSSPIAITLNADVVPSDITVNASKDYAITGTGAIGGLGALTKSGPGTLTLQTTNSFAGGLSIDGGTVTFSTLANLGSGSISFNNGTLQYANGNTSDISSRTVTLGAGGGTIDDGGNTVVFANAIGNAGTGGLTKTGAGSLTLSGANHYSGNTVVAQGTLALAAGASLPDSAAIFVNSGATLNAATSGVGLNLSSAAGQILAGTGTVSGEVTNGLNTTISPATNGVYGTLTFQNDLFVDGGTLVLDISPTNTDLITVAGGLSLSSGTLQLNVNGTLTNGTYKLIGFGSLLSGANSSGTLTLLGFSEAGHTAFLVDTATEVDLVVATGASDSLTWSGTSALWDTATMDWLNGTTPWIFTNGDFVTFDTTGVAQPNVSLQEAVRPSSVTVNSSSDYTFTDGTGVGSGKISGGASLIKSGSGTLTVNTPDDNNGGTLINAGTVQVGGSLGLGAITNNSSLVYNGTADQVVPGSISGTGTLTQQGSATLTLAANNTYSGPTIITSGALQLGNGSTTTGNLGTSQVTNNSALLLNHGSGTFALANNITGSGSVAQVGASTVTFGGSLSYQGNTYISNGVVKLTANGQLPNANNAPGSTGVLELDGGASTAGTLDVAGHDATVNALVGASGTVNGMITNSATKGTNTLTDLGGAATTYYGAIGDAGKARIQLLMLGTNQLILGSANTYSGGTVVGSGAAVGFRSGASLGTGPITMSNNATIDVVYHGNYLTPPVTTLPGATANFGGGVGDDGGWSNPFNGDSTTTNVFTGQTSWHASGQFNNFFGTIMLAGDPSLNDVRIFATTDGSTNMTLDMEGGTLHARDTGDILYVGALMGSGLGVINGSGGIYYIGAKVIDTTYGGTLGGGISIVKDGTGTLTLFGTNLTVSFGGSGYVTNGAFVNETTFTGNLTVSNGTLAVMAPNNLNDTGVGNPTSFTLANANAVLDLSSMGSSPDTISLVTNSVLTLSFNSLGTAQTLNGFGTIRGSVVASSGSTVNVGRPTGLLTVTNSIELGGAVNMNLDRTNAVTSSELAAGTFTVDSTATLVVSNAGPALVNGDKFQLFNHPVTGFALVTLPATDPTGTTNYTWTDNLAVDGSIQLASGGLSPVATNPTNITFSVSGGNLTLSWPADHLGWELQSNAVSLTASNAWYPVPNSSTTTNVTIPITAGTTNVFYRMHLAQ